MRQRKRSSRVLAGVVAATVATVATASRPVARDASRDEVAQPGLQRKVRRRAEDAVLADQLQRLVESTERIEAALAELRRAAPLPPEALTVAKAAAALSVSPTTVKRMVRAGALLTVRIGGRALVPASEVQRLTTPARPRRSGRQRAARRSGGSDAQRFREALRSR